MLCHSILLCLPGWHSNEEDFSRSCQVWHVFCCLGTLLCQVQIQQKLRKPLQPAANSMQPHKECLVVRLWIDRNWCLPIASSLNSRSVVALSLDPQCSASLTRVLMSATSCMHMLCSGYCECGSWVFECRFSSLDFIQDQQHIQQDASITWCDLFRPNFGQITPEFFSVHDVWEPWKQAFLASRDVIISSQFAARIRRGFFTLGDGCWLPTYGYIWQTSG